MGEGQTFFRLRKAIAFERNLFLALGMQTNVFAQRCQDTLDESPAGEVAKLTHITWSTWLPVVHFGGHMTYI